MCGALQEESKLDGMVQKLEGAVQQLDSPCHFTMRLIMDDSALTAILATLKLGEIRTGEHCPEASRRPAAASSASQVPVNGAGYHSGRSTPDRPSSAAAALHSSSSTPSLYTPPSPCPFSLSSSASLVQSHPASSCSSSSSPSSPGSPASNPGQPAPGFNSLRSRVVSDGRLSSHDREESNPEAVSQSVRSPAQAQAEGQQRRKGVSRSPFDFMDPPHAAPPRRKLSQP